MGEIKFGFQDHLSSEFPSQIIVDATELCNLECIHCPHPQFKKSPAYGGRMLDTALHEKLVNEVRDHGKGICRYLRYTSQGEPLIHPKIVEMISYAGKEAGCAINLTTNGVLLKEKKAGALLDAGVSVFDISLDAYKNETYADIRKRGDLEVVRKHVLGLLDMIHTHNYQAKVVLSFIVQKQNREEMEMFKDFWESKGAHYVVIRELHSCAGSKEQIADTMKASQLKDKRYPCLYPWERLVLSPSGQVGYCPADWKYEGKIAHYSETTIREIWQSEFMQKLREAHLKNNFAKHKFCGNCPDWERTRWPGQGRNYASMMHEIVPEDLLE